MMKVALIKKASIGSFSPLFFSPHDALRRLRQPHFPFSLLIERRVIYYNNPNRLGAHKVFNEKFLSLSLSMRRFSSLLLPPLQRRDALSFLFYLIPRSVVNIISSPPLFIYLNEKEGNEKEEGRPFVYIPRERERKKKKLMLTSILHP